MCGIAGLMTAGGAPDPLILDKLVAALGHRGPDGRGRHVAGTVGLVHARLSIIDLEGGAQPLHGPRGIALVGNGEIYNYRDLSDAGMALATGSDCEPPLHLYARHGLAMIDALRGMYALAIHDPGGDGGAERLILARDPFGIKPLYLAEGAFGVAFASEPQALVAAGFARPVRVAEGPRDELLQLQFTTGAATVFSGIRRLLPGETVVVEGGRVVSSTRRAPAAAVGPRLTREAEALAAFDRAMADSVEAHQRADVPYGMFLSGGIDSSVLLALMARLNDRPVRAFTAGFPGTGVHDERAHARALAAACGAEHIEVEVTERDFWDHLPAIAAAMDDPAADYAIVPTWLLAREARKSVTVILSGEGGDELFGGYGRYRAAMRPWPFARPMRRKGTFDGLDVLRREPAGWRAGMAAAEAAARKAGGSALSRAQRVDMADWLPNDLLGKLDRCLMAHGIEGRVPFLDPVVAEVAFRLSDRLKVRGGQGKWLVRRWLAKALPAARPFAPKKGFTVPVGEWIAARGDELGPLVAASPGVHEIARPEAVAALFTAPGKRERFAAWTLLFYALWHRRHVQGQAMDGGVFDVLTSAP
ncbi:asparagine synthase (glutamine-hydrolyzing) [Novispirillum sp. DQ9]|uniref:asparagine synthase (glutamine-hydrolyzing) n=1 Tax=Novispirillum sp. DQ9 TaxID=3398612 RepID=UPI003C79F512